MTALPIPESWIDEYCRATEPALFAPCRAELTAVCLSYGPNVRWLARYEPAEVAQDLAASLRVEALNGDDGPYYRLSGVRLDVFVRPRAARDSGVSQAYVTSVKPASGLGRGETIRPRQVRLSLVWDEEQCELGSLERIFAEGLKVAQRRRALRDRARRGLTRAGAAPRPRGDLHAVARRRYQPLLQMLELLEQRSRREGEVRGSGIVTGEGQLNGRPVLWLRLRAKAAFAEGGLVAVSGPGHEPFNLRVRGIEVDRDGQLLALAAPHRKVPVGTPLRLEQQGRFALGKHSAALRKFLDEQVEGDWEHLALLLCNPDRLPAVEIPRLRWYFDDRLNDEQRAAVDGAVGSPHVFHVQGPPGTGKTTVITEVVRQLVTRGERVLLLAPMHVAVDEVLRRLAELPGILALRIASDESRVAPELRQYLPEQAARAYLRQARRPSTSQATRWRTEIEQRRGLHEAVDAYLTATARHRHAFGEWQAARSAHETWRAQLTTSLAQAGASHGEAQRAHAYLAGAVPPAAARAQALRAQLRAVPWGRRFWASVRAAFGVTSDVAQLSTAYRQAVAAHRRLADDQRLWGARRDATLALVHRLEAERVTVERGHQTTVERWRVAAEAAHADTRAAAGQLGAIAGRDPSTVAEAELARWRAQLGAEMTRRQHRIVLERRWFELSGLAGGSEEALAEQVDADLKRSANLICCTTTGITRDLGESDFDTLIVDEASRVVDSEFMIGALRARRWVLVGDEHQLPPYVESDDEHHLHALSALLAVERGAAVDLQAAVDHLGQLWIEDEDLHQFRREVVLRTAEDLRATGAWQREYRGTFDAAWRRLRELGDDAERTLLTAMLDHLVRSLFERSVDVAPARLRQSLRVQRRMIEPIAALVKQPVYGGDYVTPEDQEVTPLPYGGTNTPVVFIDTSVYGRRASERVVGTGIVNDLEADLIARICRSWEDRLRRSGGERVTVSVLTFYRRQAAEIRTRLGRPPDGDFRALDIGVVDAIDKIQGQESDLVFVSFCRVFHGSGRPSSRYGRWLQDIRRLNVACTRARRALVLVGHAPTLRRLNGVPAAEEFYRNLFDLLAVRPDMKIAKGAG